VQRDRLVGGQGFDLALGGLDQRLDMHRDFLRHRSFQLRPEW
jgi:hypothetical protein